MHTRIGWLIALTFSVPLYLLAVQFSQCTRRQTHSTSRYVKHRLLACACLPRCATRLPRTRRSLTSVYVLVYCLASLVDRRKWPRSRGGGGSPLVPLSLRLAACGLAGCGCAATATGPLDPRDGLSAIVGAEAEDIAESCQRI